ncbi:hypothetical protein CYLTODRAFT_493288 [Cylindrobasidium torrendii FP15055 ss-10]|uniref:Uncharacterized protein n=1 Tax=Cylindrobasidium torrendii FP15055 ss-10 TaxID=1314674 RepID=A0A0D7B1A0_9AGAR|nr:hypothetical protein CYLTODRAFT_493288 [Cylindrobasidium torrendii FP15055 ss-10]
MDVTFRIRIVIGDSDRTKPFILDRDYQVDKASTMMAPSVYDPQSPDEQVVPLPSAPLQHIAPNVVLQPPLTRRGTGPGLIAFLPPPTALSPSTRPKKPLDPEPVFKCAEEGFAVVGMTASEAAAEGWSIAESLSKAIDALLEVKELDTKDKFAVTGASFHGHLWHLILEKNKAKLHKCSQHKHPL